MDLFVEHDRLYRAWVSTGKSVEPGTEGARLMGQGTEIFKTLCAIDKNDPNRPKNGDRYQNGARL